MASEHSPDRRLLRSWKAIAAHLQVDVRTVQRWAARSDIPIYRHDVGAKSHPTAYTDELTNWLTATRAEEPTASAEPVLAPPLPASRRPWRRWRWAAVGAALALGVGALAYVAFLAPRGGEPYRCTVEHGILRTYDRAGGQLWQVTLADTEERLVPPPDEWLIADVNGDGRNEVLYNLPPGKGAEASGEVLCFDARGNQMWRFAFGRALSWQDRTFSGKYGGRLIRAARSRDRRYVLTVANHSLWYPAQVALLDAQTGKLVEEYWHPGALHDVLQHDVDGDGVDEVLLTGANNPGEGLGHAVLLVLELPFSRSPRRTGLEMADFSGGREARYVAFGRPDLCSASGEIPFASDPAIDTNRIRVRISCATATVFHLLTFGLEASEMRLSDNFVPVHRQFEARGLLDHPWTPAEQACLRRVAAFDTAVDGNAAKLGQYWKGCE